MAKLYLIPNVLGETPWQQVLPATVPEVVARLSVFYVEDLRNARRFLKKCVPTLEIDALRFYELTKETGEREAAGYLEPLLEGLDAGVISEAGCPGVADPGALMVRLAHQHGIPVVPLVGPSSILLALMASGFSGQHFTFHGYLPVKSAERIRKLLQLERTAATTGETQIFMETPYRNNALVADMLKYGQPGTPLCIAANITTDQEMIHTQSIAAWRKNPPDLNKQPAIFLLGCS
ncbi:MAG: SAM-dependent methyltransferase [Bacteroidales bacterium]|nr:SAM-dependent methyltransferase [Bacteroidales bacterium]